MKKLEFRSASVLTGIVLMFNVSFAKEKIAPLSIDASVKHVSCHGLNDGSIEIEISGGQAPYIIAWDNGNETTLMEGLRDGEYSVKIADSKGREIVEHFCIDSPGKMIIKTIFTGASKDDMSIEVKGGSPWMINNELCYSFSYGTEDSSNSSSKVLMIEDANGCVAKTTLSPDTFRSIDFRKMKLFDKFNEEDEYSEFKLIQEESELVIFGSQIPEQ